MCLWSIDFEIQAIKPWCPKKTYVNYLSDFFSPISKFVSFYCHCVCCMCVFQFLDIHISATPTIIIILNENFQISFGISFGQTSKTKMLFLFIMYSIQTLGSYWFLVTDESKNTVRFNFISKTNPFFLFFCQKWYCVLTRNT